MSIIEIKKIGITKLDTDAIVNAANEGMQYFVRLYPIPWHIEIILIPMWRSF